MDDVQLAFMNANAAQSPLTRIAAAFKGGKKASGDK
jgi:hypothetical protein